MGRLFLVYTNTYTNKQWQPENHQLVKSRNVKKPWQLDQVVKAEDTCEICKEWLHTGCVDFTDNEYEMLASHKLGTIHWYCTTCNVISVELLRKLVPQIHVSHFPPLQHSAAFSCPASSCLAFSASPPGYIMHHNIQNKGARGVVIYVRSIVLTWKVYICRISLTWAWVCFY